MDRTEVRFASFLSFGFTTMAVINPPEKKLAKRTSVDRFEKHQSTLDLFHFTSTNMQMKIEFLKSKIKEE